MKHCRIRISNNHVIYSAVILALAIHSLKMKQNVELFCFPVVKQLNAELISNSTDGHCIDLGFGKYSEFRLWKNRFGIILEYIIILQWTIGHPYFYIFKICFLQIFWSKFLCYHIFWTLQHSWYSLFFEKFKHILNWCILHQDLLVLCIDYASQLYGG